jgi:hypothetical protein
MFSVFCLDDPESGGRILVQQGGTSTSSLTGNKDETEVQGGGMWAFKVNLSRDFNLLKGTIQERLGDRIFADLHPSWSAPSLSKQDFFTFLAN